MIVILYGVVSALPFALYECECISNNMYFYLQTADIKVNETSKMCKE
jgi:hypothetical protein